MCVRASGCHCGCAHLFFSWGQVSRQFGWRRVAFCFPKTHRGRRTPLVLLCSCSVHADAQVIGCVCVRTDLSDHLLELAPRCACALLPALWSLTEWSLRRQPLCSSGPVHVFPSSGRPHSHLRVRACWLAVVLQRSCLLPAAVCVVRYCGRNLIANDIRIVFYYSAEGKLDVRPAFQALEVFSDPSSSPLLPLCAGSCGAVRCRKWACCKTV